MLAVVENAGTAGVHPWVVATTVTVAAVAGRLAGKTISPVESSGDVGLLEVNAQVCLRALVHRQSKRVSSENVERVWISPECPKSPKMS